jgi:hypothetical protein
MTAANSDLMVLDNFFLHFLRTLLTTQRGGKNSTFRIGDGFKAAWNLNEIDENPLPKMGGHIIGHKDFYQEYLYQT